MSRPTAARRVLAGVIVGSVLAGCALPHHKSVGEISKLATTTASGNAVLENYERGRAAAEAGLDAAALAGVETGAVLEIDQSSFAIRRALGVSAKPFEAGDALVWSPRFGAYPLWFVAVARLPQQQQQVAAVFVRRSTTEPWLCEAAPRLAAETMVPAIARTSDGTVPYLRRDADATWSDGEPVDLPGSPQQIADRYADVLTTPKSRYADDFVEDSFILQMREIRKAQPTHGVRVEQQWKAAPVTRVLRLSDGGALMFVTLDRVDTFDVQKGKALRFEGSEAGAFLPAPVRRTARLHYVHQVLMLVPNAGKPLTIGQYGGLVSARGH